MRWQLRILGIGGESLKLLTLMPGYGINLECLHARATPDSIKANIFNVLAPTSEESQNTICTQDNIHVSMGGQFSR